MTTQRTLTYSCDDPSPYIGHHRVTTKTMITKHHRDEKDKNRQNSLVVDDSMIVQECNFLERSEVLTEILRELRRQQDQQRQKADEDDSTSRWESIEMINSSGRVDILLKAILQSHIETLSITTRRNFYFDDHYYSHCWPAICQALPRNKSLSALDLRRMIFTPEHVKQLRQGFLDHGYMGGDSNINIRELSLSAPTFVNGSHVGLAKVVRDCISNIFIPALWNSQQCKLETVEMVIQAFQSRQQIRFICDINRAGRHIFGQMGTTSPPNDVSTTTTATPKLWPYIFDRVCNDMALPNHLQFCLQQEQSQQRKLQHGLPSSTALYIDKDDGEDDIIDSNGIFGKQAIIETKASRRASILYHLLVNGAMVDCTIYAV